MQGQSSQIGLDRVRFGALQATVLGLAFLCALLDGLDLQVIAYVAPVVARELELSDTAMGLVFSAGFLGLAIGSVLVASLGDRWGRKAVIVLSLGFFGVCVLITSSAKNVEELAVLRFLTGIGLGGIMPNAIAISVEYSPGRYRPLMVTVTYIGFLLGAALGGVLAVFLLRQFGWQSVFFVAGILPLGLAAVVLFAMPESLEYLAQKKGVSERMTRIMARLKITNIEMVNSNVINGVFEGRRASALFGQGRWKSTILLWVAMFTNLLSLFSLLQWLPSLLEREGMPLGEANSLVSLMWLTAIIGSLSFVYISRKIPLQRVLAIYLTLSVIFTAALGVAARAEIALAWPLTIGIGLTGAAAQIGFYSLLSELYPASIRVTGIGLAQGIGRIAAIGGPAIVGVLLTAGLPQIHIFLWLAAPLLISAVAVWNVKTPHPTAAS